MREPAQTTPWIGNGGARRLFHEAHPTTPADLRRQFMKGVLVDAALTFGAVRVLQQVRKR